MQFFNQPGKIFLFFLSQRNQIIFLLPSGVRAWTVQKQALLPELLRHLPLSSRPRVTSWEICLIWTWRPLLRPPLHLRRPPACRWALWIFLVADWTAWYYQPYPTPPNPPRFASSMCLVNDTRHAPIAVRVLAFQYLPILMLST